MPAVTDTPSTTLVQPSAAYVQWGPVFAGAAAAAGLAIVLHGFAAAIGLAVSSTSPTWRDALIALWVLSGLYLILVALASYGLGGYVAGRMRMRLAAATPDEVDFRDGMHGLLVWALATLLTAVLALAVAQAATRLAAPSGGQAGTATSVGGENIIAYDLDRLFRAERRPPNVDMDYSRAEASRILLTAAGHRGMAADDRAYLVRLVSNLTGLAPPDAERRVNDVIVRARDNITLARRSSVMVAFMSAAAALLGAAAAWFAAGAGGTHRDAERPPSLWWPRRSAVTTEP